NEPGYALGVLDGNILAERIATLLKPRHPLTAAGVMAALGLSLTVVLLCAMAASALALGVRTETGGAELSGTVFDPSSAVIPEARVELAPAGSEEWQVADTGQAGEFRFANLATGEYDLRVLKQGFMRYRARISLRDSARIRPALQIGRIRETLTVIGN
ncbi:MAG: carboxypeptidase regulatory-like domain-containing protein, partial [Bryobacteraceae bacterium]|nr:carboxypeptidase regulatory-like domain-containing protein [Bryobacteraceae bacterium]